MIKDTIHNNHVVIINGDKNILDSENVSPGLKHGGSTYNHTFFDQNELMSPTNLSQNQTRSELAKYT